MCSMTDNLVEASSEGKWEDVLARKYARGGNIQGSVDTAKEKMNSAEEEIPKGFDEVPANGGCGKRVRTSRRTIG